jgi:cytochrome c biogenesis protein CcdA
MAGSKLESNNLFRRIKIIFGIFMVFFYLGLALFFITASLFEHIEMIIRIIVCAALSIYGLARAVRTYEQIREEFFKSKLTKDKSE